MGFGSSSLIWLTCCSKLGSRLRSLVFSSETLMKNTGSHTHSNLQNCCDLGDLSRGDEDRCEKWKWKDDTFFCNCLIPLDLKWIKITC